MPDDAFEVVRLRNNFYRDNYRRLVAMLLLMILINLSLVGGIAYLLTHRPLPQYFATSAEGRIIPLNPLSQPVVTPAELLQWVNQAIVSANSFNFVEYRRELQDAAQYFTPDGWAAYQAGLKASRNLETVVAKKMIATAAATGAPQITDQGLLNGRYAWRIRMPIVVTYQSAGASQIEQPQVVTVLVVRTSTLERPKGIAIAQYYAAEKPIAGS